MGSRNPRLHFGMPYLAEPEAKAKEVKSFAYASGSDRIIVSPKGTDAMSETKTVRAVCPHDCPDTCSMVITVKDGRAVQMKGDADHPFTDGFLCQKVNHYLERVYHPDRLKYPLLRCGPKGAGQFRRISWDEAIERITSKFQEITRSPDGPQ